MVCRNEHLESPSHRQCRQAEGVAGNTAVMAARKPHDINMQGVADNIADP